jgi:hypothetical protein
MKARVWVAAIGIAVLSLADILVIRATVPQLNHGPFLDLDLSREGTVVAIYGAVLAAVVTVWLLFHKRYLAGSRGARLLVLGCVVLLGVRGVFATSGSRAAFDRARAARTVAKLRVVDQRLQEFTHTHGRLPAALAELGLSTQELTDEWRRTIRYSQHPDQKGYRVWSEGAPPGKPGLEDFYERLAIDRSSAEGPVALEHR